jgi:hypothetical protein
MDHSAMGAATHMGQVRTYFIAADVVMWDYAPSAMDRVSNTSFPDGAPAPSPTVWECHADGSCHGHPSSGRRRLQAGADHHAHHSASLWVSASRTPPFRIGRRYLKIRFREYTDHSFTALRYPSGRPAEQQHLGILGPLLRGEVRPSETRPTWRQGHLHRPRGVTRLPVVGGARQVGDTLRVVFRNHAPLGYPFSMHPHGVRYRCVRASGSRFLTVGSTRTTGVRRGRLTGAGGCSKRSEGASYNDGSDLTGDIVQPGACAYYEWELPESAGPGPGDPSTVAWLYHGHVAETEDANAG